MVQRIELRNFRGIREGRLEGLAPLTILTGVNGSGKSAVLDAIYACTDPRPVEALAASVGRRRVGPRDPRWLVFRGADEATIVSDEWTLTLTPRAGPPHALAAEASFGHVTVVAAKINAPPDVGGKPAWLAAISDGSPPRIQSLGLPLDRPPVKLLDPSVPEPVETRFSDAVRRGGKAEIEALLRSLVPGFASLEILTEHDGRPALYIDASGSGPVPLGLAGDGIQAFAQLAVELAGVRESVVLIEEPEVFQHPRALRQTALTFWAAVQRGVQVIATTHSLDLIDAVVATACDGGRDLGRLALFNLALVEGTLRTARWGGDEIRDARGTIEMDLR